MPLEQIIQKSPILDQKTKKSWLKKSVNMSFLKKQKFAEILQNREKALGVY